MEAARALAELTEISSQIQAAVLLASDGSVLASTLEDAHATSGLAAAVHGLIDAAGDIPYDGAERTLVQLEAATGEGSLFVVRDDERLAAAITSSQPTAGLVFYDLKSCLRAAAAEEGDGKPRPRARQKRAPDAAESPG